MLKRISVRITTIFIAVSVLVVLITSIIFSFLFRNYTVTEQKKTLTLCAEEIAQLVSEDKASSYAYNNRIITDYNLFSEGVLHAQVWIINTNGVFDRVKESEKKSPLNIMELDRDQIELIQRGFNGEEFDTRSFSPYFGEDTLSVVVPVYATQTGYEESEESIVGSVVIHCPLSDINESYSSASGMLIASVAIAIVVSAVVSVVLSSNITKPIKQMCGVASEMAAGNYNVRVGIADRSELGELATVLNYLAYTLSMTISELSSEKDKLNDIINNVSDGLASFDQDGTLIKYNAAFLRLCPYELMQTPEVKNCIEGAVQKGETQTFVLEGKDILRFTATPIFTYFEPSGAILVIRDISQSERLENTRREFVSNVSHEFRTPLTVIKGSIEMLIDGAVTDPEMVQKTYARIEGETVALERLVRDLLDVSRLKSGKIILEKTDLDLEKLAADVVNNMQTIAQKKQIQLVFEPGKIPHIWADPDRIRQLIIIFIDNAVKFTPSGGKITVSTGMMDQMACLRFRDTGKGIAKEDIPFIFERFYKADKSRGNSSVGTGLGLSIANNIVDLHGGGITVNSEVGKGTEFSVMLPLAQGQEKMLPQGKE